MGSSLFERRLHWRRKGIALIAGAALAVPSGAQSPEVYSFRSEGVETRGTISRSGRPAFLAPPEPQEVANDVDQILSDQRFLAHQTSAPAQAEVRPAAYGAQPRSYGAQTAPQPGGQSYESGTMITQVEIPIPPPTAEPLYADEPPLQQPRSRVASSEPGRIRVTREGDDYRRDFRPTVTRRSEPAAASTPIRESAFAPTRSREVEFLSARNDENPLTIVPGTSTPDDGNVPPSIIYGKGQQALPEPPKDYTPPPVDYDALLRGRQYGEVETAANANRDSGLANALGWAYFRHGQYNAAYQWFERALQWNDQNNEAAYGMALTLFRQGRYQQAQEIIRWRGDQYPKLKKIGADIVVREASASFQRKNYRRTKEILLGIQRRRGLTREEQNMLAWSEFHLGNLESAKKQFVQLYRARRDRYSADGVYAAYARSRDWSGLEQIVVEYRGPLESLYQKYISQKYRDYGLQRQAYREAPTAFPELANISSPSVAAQVIARTRSGTEGTSQLGEYGGRIQGTIYHSDVNRLDINVGVLNLDSGSLVGDTRLGTVPPDGETRRHRYDLRTQYDGLIDFRIRWEHQCFLTPTFELGITPLNGEIDPTFVGRIGVRKVEEWGNWSFDLYRDPVRDSLLSYTGLRDPYTGRRWGRVTETGVRAAFYNSFGNDWGFYGAAGAGLLTGHNVQNNSHAQLSLAVSKNLRWKGFEYFGIGPALSLGFYDKNLSQFTYGHGGYFSPRYTVQGSLAARFMTKEGGNSLVRGNVGLGLQVNKQDAAPLFPDEPDGRWYSSINSSGVTVGVDIEGLYMLDSHWAVGGQLALNVAPDYNDFSVRLSIQYFFEPRGGLFAQDFLTF